MPVRHGKLRQIGSKLYTSCVEEGGGRRRPWTRLANENPPRLRAFDRYGHRLDEVADKSRARLIVFPIGKN